MTKKVTTSHFVKSNPNPVKDKVGDCVFRALCHATGKSWLNVYDELCDLGRKLYCPPNWKDAYNRYLFLNGFLWTPLKRVKGCSAFTVKTFAETHPKGVYVLRLAHHLVCVRDGFWYDTWNCYDSSVYGYYVLIK